MIQPTLTLQARSARAVRVRTAPPLAFAVLEDALAQNLKEAMVGGAEAEEIRLLVFAAFATWNNVMYVEDGRAGAAQEATATSAVARDDALSDLRRQRHG